MIVFDVSHLFRVYKGPKGLLDSFEKHLPQHLPAYSTVQMWRQRGTVSGKFIPAVLYCVEKDGHHCFEFFTDDEEFA